VLKLLLSMALPAGLIVLAGCADKGRYNPLDQKQVLAFSGFTLRVADSPSSLEQLGRLPQRRLLRYESGEEPMYIWVDAAGCSCWYTGDQAAYRRLVEMGWDGGRPPTAAE
jgi:hypothetical protein